MNSSEKGKDDNEQRERNELKDEWMFPDLRLYFGIGRFYHVAAQSTTGEWIT